MAFPVNDNRRGRECGHFRLNRRSGGQ
jgi:hypothetical protein